MPRQTPPGGKSNGKLSQRKPCQAKSTPYVDAGARDLECDGRQTDVERDGKGCAEFNLRGGEVRREEVGGEEVGKWGGEK